MNLEEFHEWLKKQPIEDKIVYIKYKYSWEDRYTMSNEYLEVDTRVDGYYIWLNDWNEGQRDIEILGCIGVNEIDVPLFESQKKRGKRMTYNDIYNEFCEKFPNAEVSDYRPAAQMFLPQLQQGISNAIIVWLKDGSKVIYISNNEDKK